MSEIALNNSVLNDIRCIIEESRRQAYAAANQVAVLTYWHIGKRNLEYFRQFYMCFNDLEIVNACVHNLTWTHFRAIIQVADPKAREWYAKEASEQMWSTRTLSRNIGTQYYGRRMASIRWDMIVPLTPLKFDNLKNNLSNSCIIKTIFLTLLQKFKMSV